MVVTKRHFIKPLLPGEPVHHPPPEVGTTGAGVVKIPDGLTNAGFQKMKLNAQQTAEIGQRSGINLLFHALVNGNGSNLRLHQAVAGQNNQRIQKKRTVFPPEKPTKIRSPGSIKANSRTAFNIFRL